MANWGKLQEQAGHAIRHIDIPEAENSTAIYAGAEVKGPRSPKQPGPGSRSPARRTR